MSGERNGVRALPPVLQLAFVAWFGVIIARLIVSAMVKEPWTAVRYNLASDGIGLMSETLGAAGAFELARRLVGRAAVGMRVVAFAFVVGLAVDVAFASLNVIENLYEHEWIWRLADYVLWATWVAMPIGLAIAIGRERPRLTAVIVAIAVLTYPPPFLARLLYGWLPTGTSGVAVESMLRALRLALLLAGFATITSRPPVQDRAAAAAGLRSAARSMWLRLVAVVVVPALSLLVASSHGRASWYELWKLAVFGSLVVNIISLAQLGLGALQTARAAVPELGRWPFVVGGAAALWGCGVLIDQSAWVYKTVFDVGSDFLGARTEYAESLQLVLPLVVTAGAALIAVAITGFAARLGNTALHGDAQSKSAGFVTLTLVGLAITHWMVPKAPDSGLMLMLLASGSMFAALSMIAQLFKAAADELDKEPGLPPAAVVSDAT